MKLLVKPSQLTPVSEVLFSLFPVSLNDSIMLFHGLKSHCQHITSNTNDSQTSVSSTGFSPEWQSWLQFPSIYLSLDPAQLLNSHVFPLKFPHILFQLKVMSSIHSFMPRGHLRFTFFFPSFIFYFLKILWVLSPLSKPSPTSPPGVNITCWLED